MCYGIRTEASLFIPKWFAGHLWVFLVVLVGSSFRIWEVLDTCTFNELVRWLAVILMMDEDS